jgi:AmmeMemoRadiSam system protein A
VKLARNTIARHLGRPVPHDEPLQTALAEKPFDLQCGTFVTLKTKSGRLRGCIGSLSADEAVLDNVQHNAINAAVHDPRFSPLSKEELDQVLVEVSVLSTPEPLSYVNGEDLVAKLRPRVDGVILEKGHNRATFLPQVWDQLPDPRDFLSHLCRKAGLPGDAWEKTKPDISTYQVAYFEEE